MLSVPLPKLNRGTSAGEASACSSAMSSSDGADDSMDETLHTIHRRQSSNRSFRSNQSLLMHRRRSSVEQSIHSTVSNSNGFRKQHLSSTELLRRSAVESYRLAFDGSNLPDKSTTFPKFDTSEVRIGELLGSGGFANVYEVCGITLRKDFIVDTSPTVEFTTATITEEETTEGKPQAPLQEEKADEDNDTNDDAAISALTKQLDIQRQQASRQFLAKHCLRKREDTSDCNDDDQDNNVFDDVDAEQDGLNSRTDVVARYALKRLKPEVVADPPTLLQGISDMAAESRFLASLEYHPNIIKLRGMAKDRFHQGYFIIMDRLGDTLDQRIAHGWKPAMKKATSKMMYRVGIATASFSPSSRRRHQFLTKWKNNDTVLPRLRASFGIASALAHLHKHSILYRDLKPANCGFDVRDDVKIFDFGLAKLVPHAGRTKNNAANREEDANHGIDRKNDMFELTAMCGTPRYMAPEVALGEPYNESCDVYSFAILCWQILKLKKPYGKNCTFDLLQQVWTEGEKVRPIIPNYWPSGIKQMLQQAFLSDPTQRPTMQEMELTLRQEFEKLASTQENYNDSFSNSQNLDKAAVEKNGESPTRRRSTHIFSNGRGLGMKQASGNRNLFSFVGASFRSDKSISHHTATTKSESGRAGDSGTTNSSSFRSHRSSSATTASSDPSVKKTTTTTGQKTATTAD